MTSFIGIIFHLRVVLVTIRLVCLCYKFFWRLRFTKILWKIVNIKKLRKITGRRCGWGQGQVGAVWVQGTLHRHWSSTCFTNLKTIITSFTLVLPVFLSNFYKQLKYILKILCMTSLTGVTILFEKNVTSRVLFGEWLSLNGSTELGSA